MRAHACYAQPGIWTLTYFNVVVGVCLFLLCLAYFHLSHKNNSIHFPFLYQFLKNKNIILVCFKRQAETHIIVYVVLYIAHLSVCVMQYVFYIPCDLFLLLLFCLLLFQFI